MSSDRRLYVGYLPMPPRHKALVRLAVPALLVLAAAIGVAAAATMNRPGEAVWNTAEVTELTGVVRVSPVAHLVTDSGPVLLVEQGKFGSMSRAANLANQMVTARGATLERGPIRLLELVVGTDALTPTDPVTRSDVVAASPARTITAAGEIIDSKCFAGAMKPGAGLRHKACGMLCVRGGIPAAFIGTTSDGADVWGVITPEAGGIPAESVIQRIGEPVTAEFELSVREGLPVLAGFSVVPSPDDGGG